MSPRTVTLPPTEPAMWRKLLSRVHPDAGGDHELFIWARSLQEHVTTAHRVEKPLREPCETEESVRERVPYPYGFSPQDFDRITRKCVSEARAMHPPHAYALSLLGDCETAYAGSLLVQQQRGATYKQLAAIAYKIGMEKAERSTWYRLAESIPLSQRHAGHILSRLSSNRGDRS